MGIYKILDSVPAEMYLKLHDFIKNHWKANHAFVKSKDLFDFQHYNKSDNSYNFIVALNQITNEIDALVGYIPTKQYDSNLELGDYWGAIWKRRDDVDNEEGKTLGMELFMHYLSLPHMKSLCGISLSNDATRWYKKLRWEMDYMHHYYILNNDRKFFKIADNVQATDLLDPSVIKENGWSLNWIHFETIEKSDVASVYKPQKSIEYLKNRYYKHPIYHYEYLGLFNDKRLKAVLVSRECEGNGSKVLRIVDVLGEMGGYIYADMQKILKSGEYEYVDFLNYGIKKELLAEMGFNELDFDNGKLVLPNYYEPFEKKNVKMTIVYKANFPYVAFKGDADQDRPNIL